LLNDGVCLGEQWTATHFAVMSKLATATVEPPLGGGTNA
jgi:hypothetical protein